MKTIPLSRGLVALVDDCDYEWLSKYRWCAAYGSHRLFYARTSSPRNGGESKKIYMHRLIMNPPPGMTVDHINHNSLDNRRSNLRILTHSQNIANSRVSTKNKSGYRGVHKNKSGKWVAQFRHSHLGTFENLEDAIYRHKSTVNSYHKKDIVL